jgi:hypothetical protein
MSCKKAYFAGWGTCKNPLKKASGIALQLKGKTWTDATIIASSSWHTEIADDDSETRSLLPFSIYNLENTTDEVPITTTPLGHKFKDADPIPSCVVRLKMGQDDYNWLHEHEGQEYEAFPFFQGNTLWATRKADGTLKGFRCTIATMAGLPPEDKLNSYSMYIFFDDPEEFKEVVIVSPDNWRFSDLINYVPVGLKIRVTTAFTAGVVKIYCEKVGSGDPMTGLSATTDWEIMSSNATPTVVVTAVTDEGLGNYALTVKKDNDGTPANLAATDYIVIQAHDVDSTPTYLTYLSQALQIYGA